MDIFYINILNLNKDDDIQGSHFKFLSNVP